MTDSHEVERLSDAELLARLLDGERSLSWTDSLPAYVYCPLMGQAGRRIRELEEQLRLATEIVPTDSAIKAVRHYLVTRTEFTVAHLRAHLGDRFTKKAIYNVLSYLAHGGTPRIEQVAYGRYRKPTPEGK